MARSAPPRWTTKVEDDAGPAGVIGFTFDGDTWHEPALGVKSVVQFELRPDWSGILLVLQHTGVPPDRAGGRGRLGALAGLSGQTAEPHLRYRGLGAEYARCLGNGGSR